ncbi:MAG: protein-glutamine glutaminase family protein, partial [Desulfobacterales bacterium]|nr:protein-glutamine glutaminase family protein [Desulfobacterales bacterium]
MNSRFCRGEGYPRPKRARIKSGPANIHPLCAVAGCLFLIILCAGFTGCSNDSDEDIPTPELAPITLQQARDFMVFAREMQTEAAGSTPQPVAWSMVNTACQERALAIQYAAANASTPLDSEPVIMRETEITEQHVSAMVDHPGIDSASINISGPLISEQTIIMPDLTMPAGDPIPIHWPDHHAAVVNVDGDLMVIDPSTGDEPLFIDDWAHSFVDDSVECFHMDEEEYQKVWSYWLSVMSPYELPERPARICGYTITPVFRFRSDQDPQFDQLRWTPSTLETQAGAFEWLM